MSTSLQTEPFAIGATDITGQKSVKVSGIDPQTTVAELVRGLVPKMGLQKNDADGRALTYQVRSEREGRQLNGSEQVGAALRPGDQIVLQPNVMAG